MVVADFQVENKLGRAWFFQESFLLAETSMEMVLRMPFLTLSNADIQFGEKKLTWGSYIAAKALPTTKQVELIDKKEFTKAALDEKSQTFGVHVAALEALLWSAEMMIHLAQAAQIAALKHNKAPTEILSKYTDYADAFSFDLAMGLPKNIGINDNAIELEEDKQPPYEPIYSLRPVELETLKTYIEIHLKSGFIQPSKSPAGAPILFHKKPDGRFWLCVNNQGLNNLIIKN